MFRVFNTATTRVAATRSRLVARSTAHRHTRRARATWSQQSHNHYQHGQRRTGDSARNLARKYAFGLTFVGASTVAAINAPKLKAKYLEMRGLHPSTSLVPSFLRGFRPHHLYVGSLVALNSAVFLLWRVPNRRIYTILNKYFTCSTNTNSLSMIGCAFSHTEPMHLIFNMIAMTSFASALYHTLGPYHSIAFYLNAGIISSLASLTLKHMRGSMVASLGASGAVYGLVTASTFLRPHMELNLIFLPFFGIPAYFLVPAAVGVDVVGVLKRWQRFDHAGHLGGALAGVVLIVGLLKYYKKEPQWVRKLKHDLRRK